jgi:hypothetical protein
MTLQLEGVKRRRTGDTPIGFLLKRRREGEAGSWRMPVLSQWPKRLEMEAAYVKHGDGHQERPSCLLRGIEEKALGEKVYGR